MSESQTATPPERRTLNVPYVKSVRYARSFLKQAVCELRFPTLFSLDVPKPPISFANALRHDYPNHDLVTAVGLNSKEVTRDAVHTFRSRNGKCVVTLKTNAVLLETSAYESFADFHARLGVVIAAAKPVIDSSYFTRVGLRYINQIPHTSGKLADWVNPELVGPLSNGIFGQVLEHSGRIVGTTQDGQYILHHGFRADEDFLKAPAYSIDADLSAEDVAVEAVSATVERLHQHAVNLFHWSLGPAAKLHLQAEG